MLILSFHQCPVNNAVHIVHRFKKKTTKLTDMCPKTSLCDILCLQFTKDLQQN